MSGAGSVPNLGHQFGRAGITLTSRKKISLGSLTRSLKLRFIPS